MQETNFDWLTPEDLPTKPLRDLAEAVGIPATVKLLQSMGGQSIYFPLNWRVSLVEAYLAAGRWDGVRGADLAAALGISRTSAYRILNSKRTRPVKLAKTKGFEQVKMDL